MTRTAGILMAAATLVLLAMFCVLQLIVYALSGYGAVSWLWFAGAVAALAAAIFLVAVNGPRGEEEEE